jgi:hypothetical protein
MEPDLEVLCAEVADSITTISYNLGVPRGTLALALSCFDKIRCDLSPWDADLAHLMGLACLWLGIKLDYVIAPPASMLLKAVGRNFTSAELGVMELLVFRLLGYSLESLTATEAA